MPMYHIQLVAYAWLADKLGMGHTAHAALVYYEPITTIDSGPTKLIGDDGFDLRFAAKVVPVPVDYDLIEPLLAQVRKIVDQSHAPEPTAGCKNCQAVERLIAAVRS